MTPPTLTEHQISRRDPSTVSNMEKAYQDPKGELPPPQNRTPTLRTRKDSAHGVLLVWDDRSSSLTRHSWDLWA